MERVGFTCLEDTFAGDNRRWNRHNNSDDNMGSIVTTKPPRCVEESPK